MARKPNDAQRVFNFKGKTGYKPPRDVSNVPVPAPIEPEPEPRTLREKLAARRRAERGDS
jgi:hypothetical protein